MFCLSLGTGDLKCTITPFSVSQILYYLLIWCVVQSSISKMDSDHLTSGNPSSFSNTTIYVYEELNTTQCKVIWVGFSFYSNSFYVNFVDWTVYSIESDRIEFTRVL